MYFSHTDYHNVFTYSSNIQFISILLAMQVDVTQIIEGHASYVSKTKEILGQLDLENYYPVEFTFIDFFLSPCSSLDKVNLPPIAA